MYSDELDDTLNFEDACSLLTLADKYNTEKLNRSNLDWAFKLMFDL